MRAARVSDYSVTGSVNSYEADARWRPVEPVLVRASYQRAVRRSNIGELFSAAAGRCSSRSARRPLHSAIRATCAPARAPAPTPRRSRRCVSPQGVPSRGDRQLHVSDDGYGQPDLRQRQSPRRKRPTPTTSASFSMHRVGRVARRHFGVGRLLQHQHRQRDLDAAGLTVLSQCYNLDGSNPDYDPANAACRSGLARRTGQLLTVATPYQNLGTLEDRRRRAAGALGAAADLEGRSRWQVLSRHWRSGGSRIVRRPVRCRAPQPSTTRGSASVTRIRARCRRARHLMCAR